MRKFERGDLSEFGEGREKFVLEHPDDETKLVAFLKYEKNPRFLKAQYYLTKIAHMLMPENIPDIHFAGGNTEKTLVVEKKKLDKGHDATRENMLKFYRTGIPDIPQFDARDEEISNDSRYRDLGNKLHESGLMYDEAVSNFGLDNNGNMVYVDTLYPWDSIKANGAQNGIVKTFNEQKLTEAINNLDANQQRIGLSYLERLKALYLEETGDEKSIAA